MEHTSGVGVLDKAVLVLRRVAAGPVTLAELIEGVGLPKATVHRIARALENLGLLSRNEVGAFVPGPLLADLTSGAFAALVSRAGPILEQLCQETGESAQLFQREADVRVCVAVAERASGLRDTVPLGARLPMTAGSAAHVLLAWNNVRPGDNVRPGGEAAVLGSACFSAATLAAVRRLGYAHSHGEREAGVASISAPVRDSDGSVIAAVSVSGPVERLGLRPDRQLIAAVLAAAESLTGSP